MLSAVCRSNSRSSVVCQLDALYHAQPMANENMSRGFSRAYNLALGHSLRQLWQPHAALFRGPGMPSCCCDHSACFARHLQCCSSVLRSALCALDGRSGDRCFLVATGAKGWDLAAATRATWIRDYDQALTVHSFGRLMPARPFA